MKPNNPKSHINNRAITTMDFCLFSPNPIIFGSIRIYFIIKFSFESKTLNTIGVM